MKLDASRSKAYAGGVGGAGTFLAGQTLLDNLTTIFSWLLSFLGEPPEQVAQALAYLVVATGSYFVGYVITFYAPPNEPTVEIAKGGEDDLLSNSKRQYL